MVSPRHKEHDFSELSEVYETKKVGIKTDIDQLKKIIPPKFENYITDVENQIANMDTKYEKLTNEISEQEEEWHRKSNLFSTK